MKPTYKLLIVFLFLLTVQCAVQPPQPPYPVPKPLEMQMRRDRDVPYIRVGLVWGKSQVVFTVKKQFHIVDEDGVLIAKGKGGTQWKASIDSPQYAKTVYRLVAGSMQNESRAKARIAELKRDGLDAFIRSTGSHLRIRGKSITGRPMYRIYLKKIFWSREEAEAFRDNIWNRYETFIVEDNLSSQRSPIVLHNQGSGRKFQSKKALFIQGSAVTVHNLPVGNGFHWERNETRQFPEMISLDWDSQGKLAVINILSMEDYLKGVVPSEMSDDFPLEALKAQAVAARSEALAKFGKRHNSHPFDLCADVHCQVYSGLSKRSSRSDRAVRTTSGRVLWKHGEICDAVYSACCGGHGEDNDKAWNSNPISYLQGHYDGSNRLKQYGALNREENVKKWIDANPDAFCNTTRGKMPSSLDYTRKYFRWEVDYKQDQLRRILEQKQNKNVGPILTLIPVKRGVSGRITELKVVGQDGSYIITGELNIRRALSDNTLWSACFYVKTFGYGRVPHEFVLHGAGFGHGVGMCQTGAAVMALKKHKYDKILKFYYQGVRIKKLY